MKRAAVDDPFRTLLGLIRYAEATARPEGSGIQGDSVGITRWRSASNMSESVCLWSF